MTAGTCGPHSTWSSPLAAALQRFLEGKWAAGYRYRAEAQALGALDRLLSETLSPTDPVITSAIVRTFVARRGTESETTRAHRLTLIREVCRFLALDDPRTFVPAARFLGIQRRTSVPRVLSLDEGRRFLDACDTAGPAPQLAAARPRPPDAAGPAVSHGLACRGSPSPHPRGRRSGDGGAPHSRHQVRQVAARAPGRRCRGSTCTLPAHAHGRARRADTGRAVLPRPVRPAVLALPPCVTPSTRSWPSRGFPAGHLPRARGHRQHAALPPADRRRRRRPHPQHRCRPLGCPHAVEHA